MTGHLIHVGYPKTGSNFLRRWFRGHPQLRYADGGIAGFGNVYDMVRQGAVPRTGTLYRVTSFESLVTPHAHIGGRAIDYSRMGQRANAQREVCATLAAVFPGAHVLLVTRGFRSMILSSYSQFVRAGGEEPLEEVIASSGDSSVVWDYDASIALYAAAFGERNVILMPWSCSATTPPPSFAPSNPASASHHSRSLPAASTRRSPPPSSLGIRGSHASCGGCRSGHD